MSNYRKKLIEVALPLDDINTACVKEASPFTPRHPRSLHVWWARRRLAASRAIIFAQMVDDPSSIKGLNEHEIIRERERLFDIIRDLIKWENTTNEKVLEDARSEIKKSWSRTCQETGEDQKKLPAFHDPFAGGGALPLEAQRLGLKAYASDLNPVAVLINKAMIEIPPKFAGQSPVNPTHYRQKSLVSNAKNGAYGLAEDIRYYGQWIQNEAEKRIGHLYPKVRITKTMADNRKDLALYIDHELSATAFIWARTVKSPNPAFSDVYVPLTSTFMLSTKKGKEAYIEPIIEGNSYSFIVKDGKPSNFLAVNAGTKLGRGANFKCLLSGTPISPEHIKSEGSRNRMGARLMAIVAEGNRQRLYLPPTEDMEISAQKINVSWKPETPIAHDPRALWTPPYGLTTYGDLFTDRQLVVLNTFSDLIAEVHEQIRSDAMASGLPDDKTRFCDGGIGAIAYADSVAVYLGLAISRWTDLFCALSAWNKTNQNIKNLFSRHSIPMAWDFAESNPFGNGATFRSVIETIFKLFPSLPANRDGIAALSDASKQKISEGKVVSTDPPYYDNIGYADLSDFFYVWLRKSQKPIFPKLFSTLAVPKMEELVAIPYRHESKERAEAFFLSGMIKVMKGLQKQAHSSFPITIYYAFKQSEHKKKGVVSTAWETFLDAVFKAGLCVTGTWPVRTERTNALKKSTNALASSIVLVCRRQDQNALQTTRRSFIQELRTDLPIALSELLRNNIAPVDLAQASIGPGMAVFSKYNKVIEADGSAMSIRNALQLINQVLDETLNQEENVLDSDTQFAIIWFETNQYSEGYFGEADNLARARNVSVSGVQEGGIIHSAAGKVRLYTRQELPVDWSPETDKRLTVWEATQYLIKRLEEDGEQVASDLLGKLGPIAEQARNLAYRLYNTCERNGWAEEARAYNGLVIAWPELEKLAGSGSTNIPGTQTGLFE